MTRKSLFFKGLLASFLLMTFSCGEDPEPSSGPVGPNPQGGEFDTKPLTIQLPQGSGLDLSKASVLSFGESFAVDGTGKSQVVSTPGSIASVFLFDQEDNPILAGFVTDSTATLSPESTAQMLLYYGLGLTYRDDRLTPVFLEQYASLPDTKKWEEEFVDLWKGDPKILAKESYLPALKKAVESIMPPEALADLHARTQAEKASDISIEGVSKKSGIQIVESDLGEFKVSNFYRRRAHAFVYKMSTKDESGKKTVILPSVESGTPATKDFSVAPAGAASSITGILGATVENKESEFAVAESDPMQLTLGENESEAKYKVHVVGPGITSVPPKTQAEILKLTRLEVETFAIDFMFPLIMEVYGWKGELKAGGIDIQNGTVEDFIKKTELFLKASPDVYEEIKNGRYLGAVKKTIEKVVVGAIDASFHDLAWLAFDVAREFGDTHVKGFPKADVVKVDKIFKKMGGILKIVNTALQAGDLARIAVDFLNSSQFEEWTIRAKSAKVSLLPSEETVSSRGHQKIKAEIKNLEEEADTHPYFVWKSSGKFGVIQDTKGNKGTSFESSDAEITYYSNTNASNLPEENNFEYVYVEAYYKGKVIGRDTTRLNLRKSNFQILPRSATVTGRSQGSNSVSLSIEPVGGTQDRGDFDQAKIVWETEGKYGKLSDGGGYVSSMTTQGGRSVTYRCLDSKTAKGSDKVTAKVYMRSSVDGEYFLYETLEAQVNILNDEKILIKHVPVGYVFTNNWTPEKTGYAGCGASSLFRLAPVANAERYSAKLLYYYTHGIPSPVGRTESWTPESRETVEGNYEFLKIFVNSSSWPAWMGNSESCAIWESRAKSKKGMAEVVIYLKD